MNNITKQVITELETIKAIASELADMSPRTQMEIVTLCKEICLNVDKVLEKHDIDIETLFNYVNTIESELEEIRQLIDPQHLALIDERLEDLEASILTINESIGGINETLSTHTTQIQGLQNNKQDVLTAGNNITIENNVISASGGGEKLYYHTITMFNNNYRTRLCLSFVSKEATYTRQTFYDFMANTMIRINMTGYILVNVTNEIVYMLRYEGAQMIVDYYKSDASSGTQAIDILNVSSFHDYVHEI